MKVFSKLSDFEKEQFVLLLGNSISNIRHSEDEDLPKYSKFGITSFSEFIITNVNDLTEDLYMAALSWVLRKYKGKDASEKLKQGVYNMIISKYFSTTISEIPKGKVGYFLGRRRDLKLVHLNKVFKNLDLTLEKEDPSKADFFIVGDILKEEENSLINNLDFPIVMESDIIREYSDNYTEEDKLDKVNLRMINSLIMNNSFETTKLTLLCKLLKSVKSTALPESVKLQLILYYNSIKTGYDYSDKTSKELVTILSGLVNPEHKFLLEPKFLNSSGKLNFCTSSKSGSYRTSVYHKEDGEIGDFDYFGRLSIFTFSTNIVSIVPISEESKFLFGNYIKEKKRLSCEDGYSDNARKFYDNLNLTSGLETRSIPFEDSIYLGYICEVGINVKLRFFIKYVYSEISNTRILLDIGGELFNTLSSEAALDKNYTGTYTCTLGPKSSYISTQKEILEETLNTEVFEKSEDSLPRFVFKHLKLEDLFKNNIKKFYSYQCKTSGKELSEVICDEIVIKLNS